MAVVPYYPFPNIQITVANDLVTFSKIYPDKERISRSITRGCNYLSSEIQASTCVVIDRAYGHDQDTRDESDEALAPEAITEIMNSALEQEDYYVGQMAQKSAESGALEHIICRREVTSPGRPAGRSYREIIASFRLSGYDS